uniref:Major facilitator superfamily (MFS) profile domain-containing protein n=1 Tax=Alexandrium monilatum TaxID=311494 RepID=A0A7S4Q9J3_9DINO
MTGEEAPPRCAYFLLLVTLSMSWSGSIGTASMLLETLFLAETRSEEVILMPFLLRYCRPEVVSTALSLVVTVVTSMGILIAMAVAGGIGALWSLFANRIGMKVACALNFAFQVLANLSIAWRPLFVFGYLASEVLGGCVGPVYNALLTSQFDNERHTQKFMMYSVAVSNVAYVLATGVSGVQPFWMGFVENAVAAFVCVVVILMVWGELRDASDKVKSPGAKPALRRHDLRIGGFVLLSLCGLMFTAVTSHFGGGAFLVFADKDITPVAGRRVPPQWFLTLRGITQGVLAWPIAWFYDCMPSVRYHVKLRLGFVFVAISFAILGVAGKLTSGGSINVLVVVAATVFNSLGELHFVPAMAATIATELPADMVGLFNGLYQGISSGAGIITGIGLVYYKVAGTVTFFMTLASLATLGLICLQLAVPALDYCFSEATMGEQLPLAVKSRVTLSS